MKNGGCERQKWWQERNMEDDGYDNTNGTRRRNVASGNRWKVVVT